MEVVNAAPQSLDFAANPAMDGMVNCRDKDCALAEVALDNIHLLQLCSS